MSPTEVQILALTELAFSAVRNVPGADFVSVSIRREDELETVAATDALARTMDHIQYELQEGPCYAAVTYDRFRMVNDLKSADEFPNYGPEAVRHGIRAQAGIQLFDTEGERAGLNLYARAPDVFDRSTVHFAELFATQAGILLGYAEQVEQLGEALHTRTDIGIAIGIIMATHNLDRHAAFGRLVQQSQHRNVKVRTLAQRIIEQGVKPRR
jgi:GAF domain-containing protein